MATQTALPDPSQFDGSDQGSHGTESGRESSPGGSQQANTYLSEAECLSKLSQLPGLIVMGLLTPAKANSMKAMYQELLRHHRENRSFEARGGLTDENVLEIADKSPETLNMLEGFLTREQIDLVMRKSSRKPR